MIAHFLLHTLAGQTFCGYLLMFVVPLLLPVLLIKLIGFQGLRHLFSYEPRQSVIHRLDPRLKVLYPTFIGVLTVLLNWNFVFLLLGFTLIPWILLRPSRLRQRVVMTMLITPAIGMIWSQGLFHTTSNTNLHLIFPFPWTLRWMGTPGLSSEGLIYGAQQAGRTMAAASASLMVLFTTTPAEIIWAFYKLRMPAAVGLAFTAALRFLPQMIERVTVLLQVMQIRGYDLSRPRWWDLRAWPSYVARLAGCIPAVTVPLLIGSLRATSMMAMVADARAFGSHTQRSMLKEHTSTPADKIVLGIFILLTIVVVLMASLHVGGRQG